MRVSPSRRDACTVRCIAVKTLEGLGVCFTRRYQRTPALYCDDTSGRAGLVVSPEDMHVGLLFRRQIRMKMRPRVRHLITGESDTDEIEHTSSFCRDDESGS